MTLDEKDRSKIKELLYLMENSNEYNDKDYSNHFLRRLDSMPRNLKMKMICDLVECWEIEL